MNDDSRSELMSAVRELVVRCPNLRIGQLLSNVAGWTGESNWWEVTNEQLLPLVKDQLTRRIELGEREAPDEAVPRKVRENALTHLDQLARFHQTSIAGILDRVVRLADVNVYDVEDECLEEAARQLWEQRGRRDIEVVTLSDGG